MQFVFKPRVVGATLFGECVEERVHAVFRQHHWHLSKVSVGLTPVNGPNGQNEHQCRIEMVSTELGRFGITASDTDWPSAFDTALVRSLAELRRRMQRAKKQASARFSASQPPGRAARQAAYLQPALVPVPVRAV